MKYSSLILAIALLSGTLPAAGGAADQFRADSNLVLINATVLDAHDHPVRGLTRERFRLYEDRAEQSIASVSEEEAPLSIVVVFDTSGSMKNKLGAMRVALDAVLGGAHPQDQFALVTFADRPQTLTGWSSNPQEIQNRLLLAAGEGQTSLLDAIASGATLLKNAAHARKAMVIFSDGGDNHSELTERQLIRSLEESDVQIYAIDSVDAETLRARPEEIAGPDLLDRICDHAGGRYFQADNKRDIQAAAERVSRELHSQYLIGYVPSTNPADGRFHHVRLEVARPSGSPKVWVFWRRGYRVAGN